VFESKLNTHTESFRINTEENKALLGKMEMLLDRAAQKSEQRRTVFEERNQLSPRERLGALIDPGFPFLELFNMAGYCVDDPNPETSIPGSSLIGGIGYVSGVKCLVYVDDSGINAGATTIKTIEKGLLLLDMAKRHKLPLVHLVESAGANLMQYKVELWALGGGAFAGLAELSAMGLPIITVLHGLSTAGGAYMPGMSDYVIGVKENGMAALAGANLLRAATGEESSDKELGGAEVHSKVTGLVEYLAEDDKHAIEIARKVVLSLGWNRDARKIQKKNFLPPKYSQEEILGLVPTDYRKPYDVRELVCRFVDGSDFIQFKPDYGVSTVCVQANIFGVPVGIIGNNAPIDPNGATKAAHFFQLCDQVNRPLIFLHNTTGYMVGSQYEHAGMIKHGAKMIQAVMNVKVPKIALYTGASFGAGNYGMCGFSYKPDFLLTWPNAQTGVMGGQQAAKTMEHVMRNSAKRKGKELDEEQFAKQVKGIEHHFDNQSDAFITSGRLIDHGMIDPRDTRKVLGFCLATCLEAQLRELRPNNFGIARM
tara:strand:+ start:836 stop:2452 length:1617 start_codon:yes stop_codon:yes gene_type:complete